MPSERVQRQIEALLDEAEAAIEEADRVRVSDRAEHALALDPENDDAQHYPAWAEQCWDSKGSVWGRPVACIAFRMVLLSLATWVIVLPIACAPTRVGQPTDALPASAAVNSSMPAGDSGQLDPADAAAKTGAGQQFFQSLVQGDIDGANSVLASSARPTMSPNLPALAAAFGPCATSTQEFHQRSHQPLYVTFSPPCGHVRAVIDAEYGTSDDHRDLALAAVSGDPPVTRCAITVGPDRGEMRIWSIPSC
jgi:hypothetical protein